MVSVQCGFVQECVQEAACLCACEHIGERYTVQYVHNTYSVPVCVRVGKCRQRVCGVLRFERAGDFCRVLKPAFHSPVPLSH